MYELLECRLRKLPQMAPKKSPQVQNVYCIAYQDASAVSSFTGPSLGGGDAAVAMAHSVIGPLFRPDSSPGYINRFTFP